MKILITGANGFLGYYLTQQLLQKGYEVIATSKGECRLPFQEENNFIYATMDFTDPFAVHDAFEKYKPEVVIHAGAMSKVDECELNQWDCYLTNVEGTLAVLLNAAEYKSHFIFISTDFIFDGETGMYKEDDEPNPVSFYGKTKLEAEEAVKEYEYNWAIARTVLVYGKPFTGKGNLLTAVKEKLEKGETYNIVDDQFRTPTYVEDLAAGIVSIVEKKAKARPDDPVGRGIYHLSGKDMLTPYQMACMTADHLGLDKALIKKISSAELKQSAKRPPKTGFNIEKARKELGFEPVSFEEGLRKAFR